MSHPARARIYEARQIIKFDGCYHGHADSLLVKAGSGALTFGHPDSAGVPASFTQHRRAAVQQRGRGEGGLRGELGSDRRHYSRSRSGQRGLYLPKPGYLEFLRRITTENGALLTSTR